MAETPEKKKRTLGISGADATGKALAAVTSAVLLSTLGVAGTLIGAALGSLVFTFGGVLYTRSVERGKHHAQQAAATAKGLVKQARSTDRGLPGDSAAESAAKKAMTGKSLDQAEEALDQVDDTAAEQDSWSETLRGLPWKRIIVTSVGLFVVAMVAITAFELAVGRPVSSFTGGSDSDGTTTIPFSRDSKPDDGGDPSDDNDPGQGENNEPPAQKPGPTEQPPVEETPPSTEQPPDEELPPPAEEVPDRSLGRQAIPDTPTP